MCADEDIRYLGGVKTPIRDRHTITILPSGLGGETMRTVRADREINLKGEVCPYTFVKSLLALEEMEVGQVLRAIVDYLPSVGNVPRSLANEGHEIMGVAQIDDTDWAITIRKLALDEEE